MGVTLCIVQVIGAKKKGANESETGQTNNTNAAQANDKH